MTSSNEIINTITEAFNAYQSRPGLEATIKKLQDDLDLARYEIECRAEEERKLNLCITDLHNSRDDIRLQLDEACAEIKRLNENNEGLAHNVRTQGHRISELEIDLEAERIRNKILADEKKMLQTQLDDSCSLTHKLRATLTRILGEANEVLPEVKPAATFPVGGNESHVESISNTSEPLVASNPMADKVISLETAHHADTTWKAPEIKQYSEWGF